MPRARNARRWIDLGKCHSPASVYTALALAYQVFNAEGVAHRTHASACPPGSDEGETSHRLAREAYAIADALNAAVVALVERSPGCSMPGATSQGGQE